MLHDLHLSVFIGGIIQHLIAQISIGNNAVFYQIFRLSGQYNLDSSAGLKELCQLILQLMQLCLRSGIRLMFQCFSFRIDAPFK